MTFHPKGIAKRGSGCLHERHPLPRFAPASIALDGDAEHLALSGEYTVVRDVDRAVTSHGDSTWSDQPISHHRGAQAIRGDLDQPAGHAAALFGEHQAILDDFQDI